MENIDRSIKSLKNQICLLHPRDHVEALAKIHGLMEKLHKEHLRACEEKQWRNPLTLPEVLKCVMEHLRVLDLLNCRLVSRDWSKEATKILRQRAATVALQEDINDDIGFGQHTPMEFLNTFEGKENLPFDQLNLDSSILMPRISLLSGMLDLSLDEPNVNPEEKVEPLVLEIASSFGTQFRSLNFMLEEALFTPGVLDCLLRKFPAIESLKLPFTVYAAGDMVSENTLSNLKSLTIVNGMCAAEFMWSMLRSAVNLKNLKFIVPQTFSNSVFSQLPLHHFLCIPALPKRKNILCHLKNLHICTNLYEQKNLNLFFQLASMDLQLEEFVVESDLGEFTSPDIQSFLLSISSTLTRLSISFEDFGGGSVAPLNIKFFKASFQVSQLQWISNYKNLEILEVYGSEIRHEIEPFSHPSVKRLKLESFPKEKPQVFLSVINCFPHLISLEIPASRIYIKTVLRQIPNLEELSLIWGADPCPSPSASGSCSLCDESMEEIFSGLPQKVCREFNIVNPLVVWEDSYGGILEALRSETWIGNLKNLRKLSLDKFKGLTPAMVILGISNCTSLNVLSAESSDLTDVGLTALADALNLIHVNVRNCEGVCESALSYFREKQPYCHLEI